MPPPTRAALQKLEFLKLLTYPERVTPPVVAVFDPSRQRDLVYSILNDSFSYEVRRDDCIVHPSFYYYTDHGRYTNVSLDDRDRPGLFLYLLDIDKFADHKEQATLIQQWMERERINTALERCICLLVHPAATGKQPLPEHSKSFFSTNPQEKAEKRLAESLEWFAKNRPNAPVEIFHSVKTPASVEGNLILARMAYCETWQTSNDPNRYFTYDGAAYRYLRFGMLGLAQQIYCRPLTAKLFMQPASLQGNSWFVTVNDAGVMQRLREELAAPTGSKHMFPLPPSASNNGSILSAAAVSAVAATSGSQAAVAAGARPWPAVRPSVSIFMGGGGTAAGAASPGSSPAPSLNASLTLGGASPSPASSSPSLGATTTTGGGLSGSAMLTLQRHDPDLLDVMVHCITCSILVLLRMNNAEGACQLARPHLELLETALREAKQLSPAVASLFIFRFSYNFLRLLRESLAADGSDEGLRFLDTNIHYVEAIIYCRNALVRTAVYLGVRELPDVLVREAVSASCPPPPDPTAPVSHKEQQLRSDLRQLDPVLESDERMRRELRTLTHAASAVVQNARRNRMHVQLECQIAELLLVDSPQEAGASCIELLRMLRRERWSYVVSYLSRLLLKCEARVPGCVPREQVVAACMRVLALTRRDAERRAMWTALLVCGGLDPTLTLDLDGAAAALARHNRRWVRSASVRNAEEPGRALNHPSLRCAVNTAINLTVFVRMPVAGVNIVESRLWLVCESLSGKFEQMCIRGRVNTAFDGVKQRHGGGASGAADESSNGASKKTGGEEDAANPNSAAAAAAAASAHFEEYVLTSNRDVALDFGCVPEFAGAYYLQQLFVRCEDQHGTARLHKVFPTPLSKFQLQQLQEQVAAAVASGAGGGMGGADEDPSNMFCRSFSGFDCGTSLAATVAGGAIKSAAANLLMIGGGNGGVGSSSIATGDNFWFIMSCEPEADVNFDVKMIGDAHHFSDPRAPLPELRISVRSNDVLSSEPTRIEMLVPAGLRTPQHGRTLSTTSLPRLSRDEGARFLELRRRYRSSHCDIDEPIVKMPLDGDDDVEAMEQQTSNPGIVIHGVESVSGKGGSAANPLVSNGFNNFFKNCDMLSNSNVLSTMVSNEVSITDALDSEFGCMSVYVNTAAAATTTAAAGVLSAARGGNNRAASAVGRHHDVVVVGEQRDDDPLPPPEVVVFGAAAAAVSDAAYDSEPTSPFPPPLMLGLASSSLGSGNRRADDLEDTCLVRVASALHPLSLRRASMAVRAASASNNNNFSLPAPFAAIPIVDGPSVEGSSKAASDNEDDEIRAINDIPTATSSPEKSALSASMVAGGGDLNNTTVMSPTTKRATRRAVSYEAVVALLDHAKQLQGGGSLFRQSAVDEALKLLREQNEEQDTDAIPRDSVCHVLSPVPTLNVAAARNSLDAFKTDQHVRNASNASGSLAAAMVAAARAAAVTAGQVDITVPLPPALRAGGIARLLWTYVKLGELREMQSTFVVETRQPFSVHYTLRPFRGRLFCAAVVTNTLLFSPLAILSATLECLGSTNSNSNSGGGGGGTNGKSDEALLQVTQTSKMQLPVRVEPNGSQDISFLFELAPKPAATPNSATAAAAAAKRKSSTTGGTADIEEPRKHPVRLRIEYTSWAALEAAKKEQQQQQQHQRQVAAKRAADAGVSGVSGVSGVRSDTFLGPTVETDYSALRPFSVLVQHEPHHDGKPPTALRPLRFFVSVQTRASVPLAPEHRQLRLCIDADPRQWLPVGFTERLLTFTSAREGSNQQLHVLLDLVPLVAGQLTVPNVVLRKPVSGEVVSVDVVVSQTAIIVGSCGCSPVVGGGRK